MRRPRRPTAVSDGERKTLTVGPDDVGERVDVVLGKLFSEHSRSALQKVVRSGEVSLNDGPVKNGYRLRAGDVLTASAPTPAAPTVPAENLPIDVLHEDDWLVVVNKAAGMIVHPGRGNPSGTLAAALQHRFDTLSDAGGQLRPGIVHRLDRETSGVLVVAKDNITHAALSAQFAARTVKKEYAAIARGIPGFDSDWIETHVRVDPRIRERMQVCEPGGNSRSARTFYEVAERFLPKDDRGTGYTLFRLFPHTGRTHQLRIHLRYLGHPIVADNPYGGGRALTDDEARGDDDPRRTDADPTPSPARAAAGVRPPAQRRTGGVRGAAADGHVAGARRSPRRPLACRSCTSPASLVLTTTNPPIPRRDVGLLDGEGGLFDLGGAGEGVTLSSLLHADDPSREVRQRDGGERLSLESVRLLVPVERQEVWAAGVTYKRSQVARMSESEAAADHYDRVYTADRPELFFKSTPGRVVAEGEPIRVRSDSEWTVPEPELTLMVSPAGRVVGYVVGDDVSARDIEGENPLYLPQAKTYDGSCALGSTVLLAEEPLDGAGTTIELLIERRGAEAFRDATDLSQMKRSLPELVDWLTREYALPDGAALMTGTGIVPPDQFTLEAGDVVTITIAGVGRLRNPVARG